MQPMGNEMSSAITLCLGFNPQSYSAVIYPQMWSGRGRDKEMTT